MVGVLMVGLNNTHPDREELIESFRDVGRKANEVMLSTDTRRVYRGFRSGTRATSSVTCTSRIPATMTANIAVLTSLALQA